MQDGLRKAPIANIPRLHAFTDRASVDAVVYRAGHNFSYLSGIIYPGTLARYFDLADSKRAVLVIWPRQGRPCIVTNAIAAGLARRDSWIEDVVFYVAYLESPYTRPATTLRGMGLGRARIAMEQGYVSARDWAVGAREIPAASPVDFTDMMDHVRVVKTPEEVALIKIGADLLDDVFLDVFRTDYAAYRKNYPGHQSRNAILGKPTPQQASDYAKNLEIYRGAIDRCRAGKRVADIYDQVMAEFTRAGGGDKTLLIGQSVGSWCHQQKPIMIRDSDEILEAGMLSGSSPTRRTGMCRTWCWWASAHRSSSRTASQRMSLSSRRDSAASPWPIAPPQPKKNGRVGGSSRCSPLTGEPDELGDARL